MATGPALTSNYIHSLGIYFLVVCKPQDFGPILEHDRCIRWSCDDVIRQANGQVMVNAYCRCKATKRALRNHTLPHTVPEAIP